MAADERLKRWWDGLDEQTRAEALQAQRDGRLTDRLQKSLRDAGVKVRPDKSVTGDVNEFLKMRH